MPMYGLATIPIIRKLDGLCKQVWYADDSAAIGTSGQLHDWWNKLAAIGPLPLDTSLIRLKSKTTMTEPSTSSLGLELTSRQKADLT